MQITPSRSFFMSCKGLHTIIRLQSVTIHTMAWEIENFWDKAWSNSLAHRPQDINREWRPKSSIRKVNDTLLAGWHSPISKGDIEETFRLLTGLTEESLLALVKDTENPILIRTVANYLVKDWEKGIWAIEKVLDRAVGTTEAPTNNLFVITPEQEQFFAKMKELGSPKE